MNKNDTDIVEALRGAIMRASGDDCSTDEAAYYLQTFERCGLSLTLHTHASQQPAQADHVIVPKELAEAMVSAYFLALHENDVWNTPEDFKRVYAAMLKAAPSSIQE